MYYIYKITHKENGQFYIGYTNNPKRRWNDHKAAARAGEKCRFYNALRKYGPEAFELSILQELDCTVQDIKLTEIVVIAELKPEYNCTKGGDGQQPDAETRAKKSIAAKESARMKAHLETVWEKRRLNMTPEELSALCRQANASLTSEQYQQKVIKCREANLNRHPEAEAERQRKRAETIAARTPEQQAAIGAKLSLHNQTRVLSEDAENRIREGSRKGTANSVSFTKAYFSNLTEEEKVARSKNISEKVSAKAALRTQEEKDAITKKRLESRALNKLAKEQSFLNANFADC